MNRLAFVAFLAVLLCLTVPVSAANYYYLDIWDYYNGNKGSPMTLELSSFYTSNYNCEIQLNPYVNGGAGLDITTQYYAPQPNLLAGSNIVFPSDRTCYSLGRIDTNNTYYAGLSESEFQATWTGSMNAFYGHYRLKCHSDDLYINTSTYVNDSATNQTTIYYVNICSGQPADDTYFDDDNYGLCLNQSDIKIANASFIGTNCGAVGNYIKFWTLFNSSGGTVNYYLAQHGLLCGANAVWEIYPLDDPASITALGTSANPITGSVTLTEDTIYALSMRGDGSCALGQWTFAAPEINLSIFAYKPDLECEAWGACLNGTRTRLCYDLNNITVPEFEYQTCSIDILENATLGFEEFVREDDISMCIPAWSWNPLWFGCSYIMNYTYRDSPLNWTVVEGAYLKRDFLGMTQEWASEGSRSLKMWWIPPKMGEPLDNVTCGNQTGGTVPAVYRNISNTTLSINFNVTFPASDMVIAFDVVGCDQQQHHHWGIQAPFNLTVICPEQCYAADCDSQPLSRYMFNIINATDGKSVLGTPYFDEADIGLAKPRFIDLSNLGLVAGETYNLVFAVYPESLQDQRGDCVMIDNVNYFRLGTPFIEILDGVCESRCIGTTFYQARQLSNGDCSVIMTELAAECMDNDFQAYMDNRSDFCLDDDTLSHYNEKLKKYELITCDYTCVSGACLTEEQYGEVVDQLTLYDPPAQIAAILNELGITKSANGYIWFWFSVFMLVNYVAIGLGVSVIVLTKTEKAVHWEFGGATTFISIMSAFFAGYYPIEVGIMVVVIMVVFFSLTVSKTLHSGGD